MFKMYIQRRRSPRQSINHYTISVRKFNSAFDGNQIYTSYLQAFVSNSNEIVYFKTFGVGWENRFLFGSLHMHSFCQFSNRYLLLPESLKS